MRQLQRIPVQYPRVFFIEREGALHDAAIHLQQATEHLSRIGRYRPNDLLEHQERLLAVDPQVFQASVFILHHHETVGRVFAPDGQLQI